MNTAVVVVFLLVYLGMILGSAPFLQLDRTGIALLGAIAIVGIGASLQLDFAGYFMLALPVVVPGLIVTWALIAWQSRRQWTISATAALA